MEIGISMVSVYLHGMENVWKKHGNSSIHRIFIPWKLYGFLKLWKIHRNLITIAWKTHGNTNIHEIPSW